MSMMELMGQAEAPPEAAPPGMGGEDPMAALMGSAPAEPPLGGEEVMEEGGEGGGDESTDYQEAIDALTRALNRETTDQQEMAAIQKCIAALQDLLGKNEKMLDSALGTNPQLRKALAGGA
jgi:hypothetical protein